MIIQKAEEIDTRENITENRRQKTVFSKNPSQT
jgi:hypothetical protein